MERVVIDFELSASLARAAMAAIDAFLSRGEIPPLDDVLERARSMRADWRRHWLVPLDPPRRSALDALLGTDATLRDALAHAPDLVRGGSLALAEKRAAQWGVFQRIGAPAMVLDGHRRVIANALSSLDAGVPLDDDREPIACLADDDGTERPNLHAWADEFFRCARHPESNVRHSGLPPIDESTVDHDLSLAEGDDSTSVGMDPSRQIWLPASAVLPHPFSRDVQIAVGLSGGPPTFAFAGDTLDARVLVPIRARVDTLTTESALVTFVWVPNDVEIAWDDLE